MPPSAYHPTVYDPEISDIFQSKIITPFNSHGTMIAGWPDHQACALSWSGSDFVDEQDFVYQLSDEDKVEIENALSHFMGLELDGSELMMSNFPLPGLRSILLHLAAELHDGKGFFVVRGLNSADYSPEDNVLIFLGISSYIAETRGKQDEAGNMLLHIKDAKQMAAPQEDRPARDSNTRLAFHTDQFPDILALQTQGCAAQGGDHIIASSYKIYNELAATRPDVLEILARPDWFFDSRSLFCLPERRPLLFNHNGRKILNFGRIHVMGQETSDDGQKMPQPTAQQTEALDVVQSLAELHQLRLVMQPGDLAFINNFGLLHARDEFEDSEEETRYLVRMWLKNEELAWQLPPTLKRGNDRTFDDSTEELWNVRPAERIEFKLREKFGP